MNVVLIVVGVWLVLGVGALVIAVALGRAARTGDEQLWRRRFAQMRSARDRRAAQRREQDRRSSELSSQLPWMGASDRRRRERREIERRNEERRRDVA